MTVHISFTCAQYRAIMGASRSTARSASEPPLPDLPDEVTAHVSEHGCSLEAKTLEIQLPATRGGRSKVHQREYLLHLPPDDTGSGNPMPLVVCLHGTDETMMDTELLCQEDSSTSWLNLSDKEHFVLVFPQSKRFAATNDIPISWRPLGDPLRGAWGPDEEEKVFIAELVKHLKREHNIDPRRVYAVGYSNGGLFLSGLLLETEEFTDTFAAVCNYMGGLDPEQLKLAGMNAETVAHYCEEPCVSLIGLHQSVRQLCIVSDEQFIPLANIQNAAELDDGLLLINVFKCPTTFASYFSGIEERVKMSQSTSKPTSSSEDQERMSQSTSEPTSSSQERERMNQSMAKATSSSELKLLQPLRMELKEVSGKPPIYIVTGSRESNRNYCYTALCGYKELQYIVFFDDLLGKAHEYQSLSTRDIWCFFSLHARKSA